MNEVTKTHSIRQDQFRKIENKKVDNRKEIKNEESEKRRMETTLIQRKDPTAQCIKSLKNQKYAVLTEYQTSC